MANILIRTDDETRYALKEAAHDKKVSMNTYVLRLIKEGLEREMAVEEAPSAHGRSEGIEASIY